MGWQFRRRVKILPGVTVNIGKKGATSVSFGGKGFKYNIGPKGTRTTIGLPGSGISYTRYKKHASASSRPNGQPLYSPDASRAFGAFSAGLITFTVFILIAANNIASMNIWITIGVVAGVLVFVKLMKPSEQPSMHTSAASEPIEVSATVINPHDEIEQIEAERIKGSWPSEIS